MQTQRQLGTMLDGTSFSRDVVLAVWGKGIKAGDTPDERCKDGCGAWIHFAHHGNRHSDFGWEIDHIHPVAHGGTDDLGNLQPLQWRNNVKKSDTIGQVGCAITSDGDGNVGL